MPLDEQRLSEIEAREQAATKGPWSEQGVYALLRYGDKNVGDWDEREDEGRMPTYSKGYDSTFIAAARTDIPDLVAEVRRLRAALDYYAPDGHWEWGYLEVKSRGYNGWCFDAGPYIHATMHPGADPGYVAREALGLDAPPTDLHNPSIPAREDAPVHEGGTVETATANPATGLEQ